MAKYPVFRKILKYFSKNLELQAFLDSALKNKTRVDVFININGDRVYKTRTDSKGITEILCLNHLGGLISKMKITSPNKSTSNIKKLLFEITRPGAKAKTTVMNLLGMRTTNIYVNNGNPKNVTVITAHNTNLTDACLKKSTSSLNVHKNELKRILHIDKNFDHKKLYTVPFMDKNHKIVREVHNCPTNHRHHPLNLK